MLSLKDRLPPANSLVAFEAAARNGSFAGAARELGVTPAAITHHVERLEAFAGQPLFQAAGRGRVLTGAGQSLFDATSIGLEHIANAISYIRRAETSPGLTVAAPLAFASNWLMPRLSSFSSTHPELSLRFVTAEADVDPSEEGLPLGIRYGSGDWPNLRVTLLKKPNIFPVCSPGYLEACGGISSTRDLSHHILLDREMESPNPFTIGWSRWLQLVRDPPRHIPRRIFFNSYEILIRAALSGQGVALGVDMLVQDLLQAGLLVRPFREEVRWKEGYHLVSPRNQPITQPMHLFSAWLLDLVRRESRAAAD